MAFTKEDKRRWLILQCRYYNGEEKEPKHFMHEDAMYWYYEKCWVEFNFKKEHESSLKKDVEYFKLKLSPDDITPNTLKALLLNRYMHWVGGFQTLEKDIEGFESGYYANYLKRKTNKQRRTEARKPDLIKKCKYYHGEENSPYSVEYLTTYWTWEKEWVEKIADSYYNRRVFVAQMDKIPNVGPECVPILDLLSKRYTMPRTMIAYFALKWYENIHGGFIHEYATYFEHFLQEYANIQ